MDNQNKNKTQSAVIVFLILLILGFGLFIWQQNKQAKTALTETKDSGRNQMDKLSIKLQKKQLEIEKLNQELAGLAAPKKLKADLTASQDMIKRLNKELDSLKKEKNSLKDKESSLKNKLEDNTSDIQRVSSDLREAKIKLEGYAKTEKDLDKLRNDLETKNHYINSLQDELGQVKKNQSGVSDENSALRKEVQEVKDKLTMASQSQSYWEGRLQELRSMLEQKQKEKVELEGKMAAFSNKTDALEAELSTFKKKTEELNALNVDLQAKLASVPADLAEKTKKISELEIELNQVRTTASAEINSLKNRAGLQKEELDKISGLYNHLRDQLKEVSVILSQRDDEVISKDNQISSLQAEISSLKLKLADMDNSLKVSQESQKAAGEKLSEVSNLNKNLQDRISAINGLLAGGQSYPAPAAAAVVPDTAVQNAPAKQGASSGLPSSITVDKDAQARAEELKKRVEVTLTSSGLEEDKVEKTAP